MKKPVLRESPEVRSQRKHEILLSAATAILAGLISSAVSLWVAYEQIFSDHTQVLTERRLDVYEEAVDLLVRVHRHSAGTGVPTIAQFSYMRRPFQKSVYEMRKRIKDPRGTPYHPQTDLPDAVEEMGFLLDTKGFYFPANVSLQIETYLNKVTSALNVEKSWEIPKEVSEDLQKEYIKTIETLQNSVGISHMPFEQ